MDNTFILAIDKLSIHSIPYQITTHTHSHTNAHAHTHTHTLKLATHMHTHTPSHTHTHTHTKTTLQIQPEMCPIAQTPAKKPPERALAFRLLSYDCYSISRPFPEHTHRAIK